VRDHLEKAKPSRSFEQLIRKLVKRFEFVIKRSYPRRDVDEIGDGDFVYDQIEIPGLPEMPEEGFCDEEFQIRKCVFDWTQLVHG
jgi:hypothetical protein